MRQEDPKKSPRCPQEAPRETQDVAQRLPREAKQPRRDAQRRTQREYNEKRDFDDSFEKFEVFSGLGFPEYKKLARKR